MNNPNYVKVDDKLYKINTDFRVAIECNKIAQDTKIGDYERAMAIIYKLFGEDGLSEGFAMDYNLNNGIAIFSITNEYNPLALEKLRVG